MQYVANEYHMQVEIDAKECQIPDDERLRIQPNLDRLGQEVQEFPTSRLYLTIVYHPRSQVYHAQAKLILPGKTIKTGERNTYLDIAFQRCIDKVIHRVKDYRANPDREAVQQAERKVALESDVVQPIEPDVHKLNAAVEQGDYQAFRHEMLGQEEPIRMRVGRWIQQYPEVQSEIGQSIEIADLVEEVFLLAFERYAERQTYLSVIEWLESLIDPAMKSFWSNPDDRLAVSYAETLIGQGR